MMKIHSSLNTSESELYTFAFFCRLQGSHSINDTGFITILISAKDSVKHAIMSQIPPNKIFVQGRRACLRNHQFTPMVNAHGHHMLLGIL